MKTDWNLIIQGNISLLWIQECLNPENGKKTLNELLKDFKSKNENCDILNPGTLFMATYLLFLYPKESEVLGMELDSINMSKFNISILGKSDKKIDKTENNYLMRRIRNSIAHGNFSIDPDLDIVFEDNNKNKSNPFRANIHLSEFGNFINEFMMVSKRKDLNNYDSKHIV